MKDTKEEKLIAHMHSKNKKLEEEMAFVKADLLGLGITRDAMVSNIRTYDFILHEFETVLLLNGVSQETITKLKDRGKSKSMR